MKTAARCAPFTSYHPDRRDIGGRKDTNDAKVADNVTPYATNNDVVFKEISTGCKDLKVSGHKLNGLHLVKTAALKTSKGTNIETVHCNFQLSENSKGYQL